DDNQYATWGDGGGFGGDNRKGRVSLGVARIEGTVDDFDPVNIWGGYKGMAKALFAGKSYGILDLEGVLWLWRTGNASDDSAFSLQELFYSRDKGISWQATEVKFTPRDFRHSRPFFAPTFLQFGAGYQGSRDNYVYIYSPNVTLNKWDVQLPGEISLMRVPRDAMAKRDRYEFFAGINDQGQASWSKDVDQRSSVFSDANGVMRTSVSYNEGLQRYLLITQQVSRFQKNGHIGIYEAEQPWGPWRTVLFASPWELGLQTGNKSVYWNFSNKWSSKDGRQFSLVYTGPGSDNFGVVRGQFITMD
ncbi:MAG: DUF4185 domain-containing protein, partial [Gammaproteobacteria bacterium]